MAQESDEVLRIILMIGQALVPPASSCLRMLARGAANFATSQIGDRINGHGTLGRVRNAKRLSGPIETIDITDKLDRADIRQLNKLCRKCGCAFAVTKLKTAGGSRTALQFEVSSASTLEAVLNAAIGSGLIDRRDVAEAVASPDENAVDMRWLGREWKKNADGDWEHRFTDVNSRQMSAIARTDGTWEIREKATGSPVMLGNEVLKGSSTDLGADLGGAMSNAAARIDALRDPKVMADHMKRIASPAHKASMQSKDVIRSASAATKRKKPSRKLDMSKSARKPRRGARR